MITSLACELIITETQECLDPKLFENILLLTIILQSEVEEVVPFTGFIDS